MFIPRMLIDESTRASNDFRSRFIAQRDTILMVYWMLGVAALLLFAFAQSSFVSQFVNSDRLLIVDWTHHVFAFGYDWRGFQLPRTPSIFPDFVVSVPVQLVTGSWRMAIYVGAVLSLVGLICAIALIASRLVHVRMGVAMGAAVIVLCPLLVIEALSSSGGRHFGALYPVTHGESFIVSLFAIWLVEKFCHVRNLAVAAAIFALCALTVLSDKLFVFYFCFPIVAALIVSRQSVAASVEMIVVVATATALGWFGADLFERQPDVQINFSNVIPTAAFFLRDMQRSVIFGSVIPALIIVAVAGYVILHIPRRERGPVAFFYTAALISILGTVALTAGFLYEDQGSYRYLMPLMWWPVIAIIVGLTYAAQRRRSIAFVLATGISTLLIGLPLVVGFDGPTSIWERSDPLLPCIQQNQLRSGLAGYWEARLLEVLSDWSLQIDQINPSGEVFRWGNDVASYGHSQFNRAEPPRYNFIVSNGLDPTAIRSRFGASDRTVACGTERISVYKSPVVPE